MDFQGQIDAVNVTPIIGAFTPGIIDLQEVVAEQRGEDSVLLLPVTTQGSEDFSQVLANGQMLYLRVFITID